MTSSRSAPHVVSITSRDNPLLVRIRKLSRRADAYRKLGSVWLEGAQLCEAFLARGDRAGAQAVVAESAWQQPHLRGVASATPQVVVVPDPVFAGLSGLDTPAAIALIVPWTGPGAIRSSLPSVVLDRVQDAGNVGTILRSAAAFGFAQVIALEGTAALWSPKVLRAAMGAHAALHVVESAPPDALATLGVPLLATSSHAAQLLPSASVPWPCAWLFGHEGQGVDPALAARCDASLAIPQPGGEESLNVAVAASICLYESARRRGV